MTSLRDKLALSAVVLLVLFMGSLLAVNALLLQWYYVLRTRAPFMRVYEQVRAVGPLAADQLSELVRRLGAESGYKLMITGRDGLLRFSSAPEFRQGARQELPKDQKDYFLQVRKQLEQGLVVYGALDKSPRGQSVVQLMAQVDAGLFLIVTQPLQQLRVNVRIAASFFLIIGLCLLLLSVFSVMLLSGRMIRPILDITDIAASIARLDFSRRYGGKARDELGLLGHSINTISERLSGAFRDLQAANEQLREEMQVQKRFLAGVSHEFKTPVALIRGYAESIVLGMAKSRGEQEELAGIIVKEADRLSRLVSDIVFVIRMGSGAVPLHIRAVDLGRVLRELVARFSAQVAERKVRISIDLPEALPIRADEERISQVLDNLLSNALRHVPAGGTIQWRVETGDQAVRVEVLNTGDPIGAEHLTHLFEPFYRVEM